MKKLIALVMVLGFCGVVFAANNDNIAISLHRLPGATISIQEASLTYDIAPGANGWDQQTIHIDGSYSGTSTVSTFMNGYGVSTSPEWGQLLDAGGISLAVQTDGGFLTIGDKGTAIPYVAFPTPGNSVHLGTSPAGAYTGTGTMYVSLSKGIFNTVLGNGSEATFNGSLTVVSLVN